MGPDAMPWLWSLLSTLAVSSVSLFGLLALMFDPIRQRRLTEPLLALGVGTLLGDAFIHLVPSALAAAPADPLRPSSWMLGGVLLFFCLDRLLRLRAGASHRRPVAHVEVVALNLVGDGIHNFIDGMLIAAGYLASPTLGLSTTIAILCHELPQEFADFGILIHGGLDARRAIALNLASASAAVLGTLCTLALGTVAGPALIAALVPLTAGGFVYIAAAQLIPELPLGKQLGGFLLQLGLVATGIALMAGLALLE